jgi:hypothetical protein
MQQELELLRQKTAARLAVVVRSLSSRRELEELVRVQLVLQISAMVVLLKDQFLGNTMSALLRK